jgi:predicted RNA-binding Zn ribbon-like protein
MPRQTGKSTTVVSYLLHYAVFNDSVNIGILANKAATARELLVDYKLHMRTCPNGCNRVLFMEQRISGVRKWQ